MAVKKQIWEEHEVLYHYTSENALKSILKSQTLWATHYKFLNDPTEIAQMKNVLITTVTPQIKEIIKAVQKTSLAAKREIRKLGGLDATASSQSEQIIDLLYQVTFEGGIRGVPFAEPYIVSFCSHDDDRTYTQENGLLSQWRAYGRTSGCAIIFDCKKLADLMVNREHNDYYYLPSFFGDVVYEDNDDKIQEEFSTFLEILPAVASGLFIGDEPELGDLYEEFVKSTSRFKHQAFEEEREVRIVSNPMTKKYFEHCKRRGIEVDVDNKPLKKIHMRQDPENKKVWIPYIKLLESVEDELLPIREIIIGPGQDQTVVQIRTQELVTEIYCKSKIETRNSKTPFRRRL